MTSAELKNLEWTREQQKRPGAIFVPIRTRNPLNGSRMHWAEKKRIREAVKNACLGRIRFDGPITFTVTRLAPKQLEEWDGLPAALKFVLDGIADALGTKDHDPRITWAKPKQEVTKAGQYGVRIEAE